MVVYTTEDDLVAILRLVLDEAC
ncbi:hypothetical protein CGRA01v4_07833 [Colletotrichum graminicola]|nr:hypothetical protein CGRA01v4_07833 [Colletotrichum graminicola]